MRLRIFRHPDAGELRFIVSELEVSVLPGTRLIVYTPEDSATRTRLPSICPSPASAGQARESYLRRTAASDRRPHPGCPRWGPRSGARRPRAGRPGPEAGGREAGGRGPGTPGAGEPGR